MINNNNHVIFFLEWLEVPIREVCTAVPVRLSANRLSFVQNHRDRGTADPSHTFYTLFNKNAIPRTHHRDFCGKCTTSGTWVCVEE